MKYLILILSIAACNIHNYPVQYKTVAIHYVGRASDGGYIYEDQDRMQYELDFNIGEYNTIQIRK